MCRALLAWSLDVLVLKKRKRIRFHAMSNNLHPVEAMLHSGGLVFLLCVLHKSTTFSKQQIDNVEKARDSIAKSVCMSTKNKLATLRRQWDHFCTQAILAWQPYWVCLLIIIIMYTLVHWSISPGCPLFDLTPLEYCSLLAWLVGPCCTSDER